MFCNLEHLRTQNENRYLGFPELVLYWGDPQHLTVRCANCRGVRGGSLGGKFNAGEKH